MSPVIRSTLTAAAFLEDLVDAKQEQNKTIANPPTTLSGGHNGHIQFTRLTVIGSVLLDPIIVAIFVFAAHVSITLVGISRVGTSKLGIIAILVAIPVLTSFISSVKSASVTWDPSLSSTLS
ncbi:unnamed protein product [Cylindrotheca closterium]|uniref:Uncharacterized protein n=1 Tax=Cylindrotheca closterium TaxID=2856 RepID=A0AAD2CSG4_9STRA|nr:unnamed protein product [Cylindrotheca closterium]